MEPIAGSMGDQPAVCCSCYKTDNADTKQVVCVHPLWMFWMSLGLANGWFQKNVNWSVLLGPWGSVACVDKELYTEYSQIWDGQCNHQDIPGVDHRPTRSEMLSGPFFCVRSNQFLKFGCPLVKSQPSWILLPFEMLCACVHLVWSIMLRCILHFLLCWSSCGDWGCWPTACSLLASCHHLLQPCWCVLLGWTYCNLPIPGHDIDLLAPNPCSGSSAMKCKPILLCIDAEQVDANTDQLQRVELKDCVIAIWGCPSTQYISWRTAAHGFSVRLFA